MTPLSQAHHKPMLRLVADSPAHVEPSLTPLDQLRQLAVLERRALMHVVDEANPIEAGRYRLAEVRAKVSEGLSLFPDYQIDSSDSLFKRAKEVAPHFNQILEQVAEATHGQAILPGLKGRARVEEKMKSDYSSGGYEQVRDVVRGSLVFDRLEDLYQAVEKLYGMVEIVSVKDRFLNPTESGYSDMKLNLVLNVGGKPFVTELQLHLSSMLEAKKQETELYKKRRVLMAKYKLLRDDDPKKEVLKKEIDVLETVGEQLYQRAAENYHHESDRGIEDLLA